MLLPFKLCVSRIPDSTNTPATLLAKSESFDILRKEKEWNRSNVSDARKVEEWNNIKNLCPLYAKITQLFNETYRYQNSSITYLVNKLSNSSTETRTADGLTNRVESVNPMTGATTFPWLGSKMKIVNQGSQELCTVFS